nr:MAG TPA: hypothetical protein [Caudoviricetes sp.]
MRHLNRCLIFIQEMQWYYCINITNNNYEYWY